MTIQQELKAIIEYTESPVRCGSCEFFCEDMTTDNFGPGDTCRRNLDIILSVSINGQCKQFTQEVK